MAYIRRDIDATLKAWQEAPRRKPLLLRGVRQCGKTSAVRQLAGTFENYVEINLEKQQSLHSVFEGDLEIKRIIPRLELEASGRIVPGKTLLFLDEIQACPRAITALRYFYEEMPSLHVLAAGSLLEFVLNREKGPFRIEFPVGRLRSVFMYPFSFREFLLGTGQEPLCRYLDALDISRDRNDAHEKLLDAYKTFLIVGGMPEAVAEYAETGSLLSCQRIHRDIAVNFLDDFGKYDSHVPADIIRKVFDYALHNVCGQTRASSAIAGISAYYFNECVTLLKRAGLVHPVKASACDAIPPGASEKETNKKLLLFDTGIYLTECGLDAGDLLAATSLDAMNKGKVVEMQTGLELIKYADPYREAALFYWYRTGANAEVDYVLQLGTALVPVEVKASGKGSMQSLKAYLETHPSTPYGIRVSMENFAQYDNIHVYPVYAMEKLMRLKNSPTTAAIF